MVPRRALPAWMSVLATVGLVLSPVPDGLAAPSEELSAAEQERPSSRRADFLFGFPKGSFRFRGGWTFARARGEIYDFVTEALTIDKGDFGAPTVAIELSYRLSERVAATFGFEYSRAEHLSEFRDYVDTDDQPIIQETRLSQIPVTGSLRIYLTDQGQEISRYAWIPNSFAPYVGGGAGAIWYRFRQLGDFVDFQDLSIFSDQFESTGWSSVLHVFGGIDIKLVPRVFLTLEARYSWADAELSEDFVGFEPIDLTGLRTTAGIDVLF